MTGSSGMGSEIGPCACDRGWDAETQALRRAPVMRSVELRVVIARNVIYADASLYFSLAI
jgi:hypothetical protein